MSIFLCGKMVVAAAISMGRGRGREAGETVTGSNMVMESSTKTFQVMIVSQNDQHPVLLMMEIESLMTPVL